MPLGQADVGDIMTLSHIWGDAGRAHSWWLMRIKEVLFTYYSMEFVFFTMYTISLGSLLILNDP